MGSVIDQFSLSYVTIKEFHGVVTLAYDYCIFA
jgi:hypothetical protein